MLQFELKFKLRAADFFNCYPVLMCRLGTNGLNKANSVTGTLQQGINYFREHHNKEHYNKE